MKNRFNLNEEEKNRIRGLHGINVINEQTVPDIPDEEDIEVTASLEEPDPTTADPVDAEPETEEIVDDEITDEEIVDVPEDEDSWLEERWEDLTDAVKNIFRRSKHFAGCKPRSTSCPSFNKVSRNRKKRILRAISLNWPRIKWPRFVIRLPKIRFRKFKRAGKKLSMH